MYQSNKSTRLGPFIYPQTEDRLILSGVKAQCQSQNKTIITYRRDKKV